MTDVRLVQPDVIRLPSQGPSLLLRLTVAGNFVFPAAWVLPPLGAVGTVPLILSLLVGALWAGSWILGLHDPVPTRHPGRLAVSSLLLVSCLSYAALYAGWTGESTVAGRASADRWMILLLASLALVVVTAETVRTLDDALRFTRAMLRGAMFCTIVAVIQFVLHVNPTEWIGMAMPGFEHNGGDTVYQVRGAMLRVAGTTFTPIELGVVCSMLLPLSIWRLVHDHSGHRWMHGLGTALLVMGVAMTISRSGILGILVAMAVFLPFLGRVARQWVLVSVPVAVAGLFLVVPGLMSTLGNALVPPSDDPSISTRTNNYPRVVAMVAERPWLGRGPGNYLPENALHILDNQYLNTLVTMGFLGLAGLMAYLLIPALTAFAGARAARTTALRELCAAIAAGCSVGAVGSLTFDSLSFPVFALAYPALVGLGGAAWLMVRKDGTYAVTVHTGGGDGQ